MDRDPPNTSWSLQDAKNRFSEVVNAAQTKPQTVTKHGNEAVVVVSAAEYKRLKTVEQSKKMTFNEMLLAIPQAPEGDDEDIFPRMPMKFRDIDL